ncbi:MFS transporter [Paraburkholderia strydomiana]|nr:MFS transporter [Paraburkholderia strydomiana]
MKTKQSTSFRYRILSAAVVLALVNYVDRGALSYAAQRITAEYDFSKEQWGFILGCFGYGYMVGALFGGGLADRLGTRKIWMVAGVAWSVFEIATAWAGQIGLALMGGSAIAGFATIRILFGISEGPAYSLINKTVANGSLGRERGFMVSVGLLSTPLGALLTAPIAVGLLRLTGDWRIMFGVLGVAGIVMLLLFLRIFTDLPESNPRVSDTELHAIRTSRVRAVSSGGNEDAAAEPLPWWHFFKSKTLVLNSIAYFSYMYVNFLLLTWTPKYLQDQFGYSLSSLWYVGMIPWTGSCITVLLGGRISDWLLKRTGSLRIARSGFATTCLLATSLCFVSVSMAHTVVATIALMTLANALNSLPNCVYWAVIVDTAPLNRTGTFSGLTHFFANTASVLAPTLTGYLTVEYGYSSMFVAAAVTTAIGMGAMSLVRPGLLQGGAPNAGGIEPQT